MPEQGRDGDNLTIKPDADLNSIEHRLLGLLANRRKLDGGRHKINAVDIALALGCWQGKSKETKKRAVRAITHAMRDKGVPIVSDFSGYWLAVKPEDYAAYHEMLRRNGLTHLATLGRSKRSSSCKEAAGQRSLF